MTIKAQYSFLLSQKKLFKGLILNLLLQESRNPTIFCNYYGPYFVWVGIIRQFSCKSPFVDNFSPKVPKKDRGINSVNKTNQMITLERSILRVGRSYPLFLYIVSLNLVRFDAKTSADQYC